MGRFIHHIQEQLTLDDWRFTVTVWFSYHDLTPCGRYIKNLKFEPVTFCHLYSSRVANVILFFHSCLYGYIARMPDEIGVKILTASP